MENREMAFTVNVRHHHIKHPELGWLTAETLQQHPRREIRQLAKELGPKFGRHFRGGERDPKKLYHVEIDCSTGFQSWQEIAPGDDKGPGVMLA
jgi:hypothetical protein